MTCKNSYIQFQLSLFLSILGFTNSYAQYTEIINSNKPGFSQSPYSVGSGVYQFESNVFFRNTNPHYLNTLPQSLGIDLFFRTSFFSEKLEINTQISFQRDKIPIYLVSPVPTEFTNGIGYFTVGAKYLVYQREFKDKTKEIRSWRKRTSFDFNRLIPSVAIFAGANTDVVNEIYQTGTVSPKVGLLLQNDLTYNTNIITNFYYDKIGTDFEEYILIVTGTLNLSDQWSTFFENQTVFQEFRNISTWGTGLAYLVNKNLQINTSLRYISEGEVTGFNASFGASYRLDRHEDEYFDLDENGNRINKSDLLGFGEKKGFFNKMFGFLKKNKKKAPKVKKKKTKKKRKN